MKGASKRPTTSAAADRVVKQASAHLAGKAGQDVVRRQLQRHGLPTSLFDDIVQEVIIGCWRAASGGTEIEEVAAFANRLVQRRCRDLLRGRNRRPDGRLARVHLDDEGGAVDPLDALAGGEDPADELDAAVDLEHLSHQVDRARSELQRQLRDNPHHAASALAVLTITHADATPAADCPTPKGGVAQSVSTLWAGLFYSGPARCFPTDDDPEDAAMRQRRSRALDKLRTLLQSVVEDLHEDDHDA